MYVHVYTSAQMNEERKQREREIGRERDRERRTHRETGRQAQRDTESERQTIVGLPMYLATCEANFKDYRISSRLLYRTFIRQGLNL